MRSAAGSRKLSPQRAAASPQLTSIGAHRCAAMEDGWVEYVDPASGHPYLYHAESGESRWVVAKPPEPPGSPNGHAVNGTVNGAPHDAAEAEAASSSSSSSSSSDDDDERGISDDEFDDPDLEAKFRRMLETPEGREAVDAERARAERLVDRRERERYEAWRRRRRRQSGGGGFLSTLATLATLPLKVSFGMVRWGWNRWRRRPEAAGDGSDVV